MKKESGRKSSISARSYQLIIYFIRGYLVPLPPYLGGGLLINLGSGVKPMAGGGGTNSGSIS